MPFDYDYHSLIKQILVHGENIKNERTGVVCKTLYHARVCCDFREGIPTVNTRKLYPKSAAAELAWTLLGTQETEFIKKYSKMWSKFEDEPGRIIPAYGWRWRKHFGRDQLLSAINALKLDSSNRQVYVTAWDPTTDGLDSIGRYKNVPCPLGFMLNITAGNKLNMSVIMRSSDVIVGLPYDIMMYSMLCKLIANELKISAGCLTFFLNNAHIYEPYLKEADAMVWRHRMHIPPLYVPQEFDIGDWDVSKVTKCPDEFVEYITETSKKDEYPPIVKFEVIE